MGSTFGMAKLLIPTLLCVALVASVAAAPYDFDDEPRSSETDLEANDEPRDLDLDDDLELLHRYDDDEGEDEPDEVAMRDAAVETDDNTKEESEHNVKEDGDDLDRRSRWSKYYGRYLRGQRWVR